jgi:hypothetical protein
MQLNNYSNDIINVLKIPRKNYPHLKMSIRNRKISLRDLKKDIFAKLKVLEERK